MAGVPVQLGPMLGGEGSCTVRPHAQKEVGGKNPPISVVFVVTKLL